MSGNKGPPDALESLKEHLRQFALERKGADKAQVAAELRELYEHVLAQAERLGIQVETAVKRYLAEASRDRSARK